MVFPDAALAGADRDDVLHAFDRRASRSGARHRAHAGRHLDVDRGHARQRGHARVRLVAHLILHRARRRRQLDAERHAAAVDAQVLDEAERDDVLVQVGILDGHERAEHRRFGNHTSYSTEPVLASEYDRELHTR